MLDQGCAKQIERPTRCAVWFFVQILKHGGPGAATPTRLEQATQLRRKVSSVMLKLDVVFHVGTFNAMKF